MLPVAARPKAEAVRALTKRSASLLRVFTIVLEYAQRMFTF